jgi:hypothetical protein
MKLLGYISDGQRPLQQVITIHVLIGAQKPSRKFLMTRFLGLGQVNLWLGSGEHLEKCCNLIE